MAAPNKPDSASAGHRQRLRERFIDNEKDSRADEALLELLLTYAIPLKDVKPLAQELLAKYGDLISVLMASPDDLIQINGIKDSSATLLKLVDHIRIKIDSGAQAKEHLDSSAQLSLYESSKPESQDQGDVREPVVKQKPIKRSSTGLFGKAILAEAIDILPRLPDSDSLDEIRAFLRSNLRFNAEQTRQRNTNYIMKRMFGEGSADAPLRHFAKAFPKTQELMEVCYFRFMRTEMLQMEVVEDLLIPNISLGCIPREWIKDMLKERYPDSRSITEGCQAIVDALKAGGIANADSKNVFFAYRDIPANSFAFVLSSEYPEPGIYSIDDLERNRLIRAMLWNPDRISYALYEMRNNGLISKISEIDGIRQFSTKHTLEEIVSQLTAE